jgi:hypothetical protein
VGEPVKGVTASRQEFLPRRHEDAKDHEEDFCFEKRIGDAERATAVQVRIF